MKRLCSALCAIALTLVFTARLVAQSTATSHVLYRVTEVGTFGGPNSVFNGSTPMARKDGTIVGAANTDQPDPNAPNCFDPATCFVLHAYRWHAGHRTDLGALPGDGSSYTNGINPAGLIVGHSETAEIVPASGYRAFKPTVWYRGQIINLGTLGGYSGTAVAATDDNFVMGFAENGIIDNSGFSSIFGFGGGTEMHAFGWRGGDVFDLGNLGGPGAVVSAMNKYGQIVGFAPTSFTPGPFGTPAVAPYRWTSGNMRNLGTLGGKFGSANAVNNRGDVVGSSSTRGEPYACFLFIPGCHPFFWRSGVMHDLGARKGHFTAAELVNDAEQVVGFWATSGLHAVMWDQGSVTEIGLIPGDNNSRGFGMNASGRVVGQTWHWNGQTTDSSHAFVWQNGEGIVDLNTVLTNETDLFLVEADAITDNGIIVAFGVNPDGNLRTAILTPDTDARAVAVQPRAALTPQAHLAIARHGYFQPTHGLAEQIRRSAAH